MSETSATSSHEMSCCASLQALFHCHSASSVHGWLAGHAVNCWEADFVLKMCLLCLLTSASLHHVSQHNLMQESDATLAFSLFSRGPKTSTVKVSGTLFCVGCKIHLWFYKNPHLHEEHSVKVVVFLPLTVSDYSCLTTSQKELRSFLFDQKQTKISLATSYKTLFAETVMLLL